MPRAMVGKHLELVEDRLQEQRIPDPDLSLSLSLSLSLPRTSWSCARLTRLSLTHILSLSLSLFLARSLSLSRKHLELVKHRLQEQRIPDPDVRLDYTPFLTPFHFHLFEDWGVGLWIGDGGEQRIPDADVCLD